MAETWCDVVGRDGVRLRTRVLDDAGATAPSLLLLHGLASSQHIWDLVLPRLARNFVTVTFDARGHGRSGKPTAGYGFAHVAADALAVARATGLRRPVIVGHSWGAMVALETAARTPDALAGTVLVDGGVAPIGAGRPWPEVRDELAPPPLAGMHVDEFRRSIPALFGCELDVTPAIEEIVLAVVRVGRDGTIRPRLSRANHLRILRAIWQQDPLSLHASLRVPALAILAGGSGNASQAGREDEKRRAARALAASRTPTRVSWIRGIHDLPLQHPGAIARRIERFAEGAVG